jgi:4-amino-4-deoxy-L-arabinose transferase-like glycosyltransferase
MQKIIRQLVSLIEQKNRHILVALILSVVLSGVFYSIYLGDNLNYYDEETYHKLASNIVSLHQYTLDGKDSTAFRPPGYPLFLSFFISLGADIVYLRILNFIALGLCIYLLYRIIEKQSSRFAGIISAILIICYPVLFYTAGKLYPQTIASFLFLLIIFLLTRSTNSNKVFFLAGLLFGCLILTVPTFIFTLFIFVMWFLFFKERTKAKKFLITIIISFLLISIWSVRHYIVFGSFIFIASMSGTTLLLGNSENTTPATCGAPESISKYTTEAKQLNLTEIEKSVYHKSKAIEFILNHKRQIVKLYFKKLLNHFNYRSELSTKTETSSLKDFLMLITYGPLLLLFFIRIFLMKTFRLSSFEVLLIILYFAKAFFMAIFCTRIRYRLPFDFLLIGVVAMFLHNIFNLWLARSNANVKPLSIKK